MSTLFGALSLGRQALLAQQTGLEVTENNIANVNTPGYARQRAEFVPGDGLAFSSQTNAGVRLVSIESYRSRLMDVRVNDEIQRQGEYQASSEALQQVETLFDDTSGLGLQSAISSFFNSFSSLANTPEDSSLRQQVLARGEQLGDTFRSVYEDVQAVQSQQNQAIAAAVAEINTLVDGIAKLNVEVAGARGALGNENSFVDERQQLIDKLAGLVDISYYESDSGSINITSRQGALLVTGSSANHWQVATGPDNMVRILNAGTDITGNIQSGKLGGLVQLRDDKIPSYLGALDEMAATILSSVNAQHALGADADGLAGGNFFTPFTAVVPGSNQGAARAMQVAINDVRKIAAAAPAAGAGSNQNAKSLAALKDRLLMSGNSTSLTSACANLVFNVGLDTKTSVDGLQTQTHLLDQLQSQRDSNSGVSLDEEAINLMRFQKAFEASSRYISVINALTEDVLNILGG